MPTGTHSLPSTHTQRPHAQRPHVQRPDTQRRAQRDLEQRVERQRRELERLDESGHQSQWTARYWRARTLLNEMRQAAVAGWHQLYDTVDELALELERSARDLSEATRERLAARPPSDPRETR